MKTITIHQPQYIPWLAYFDKILRSDEMILLDDVAFQKNGVQNRNQIKTAGGVLWLTVPVSQHLGQLINQVEVSDTQVFGKHLKTLSQNYSKAPFYGEVMDFVGPVLEKCLKSLSQLNNELMSRILSYLGYKGGVLKSSEMKVEGSGSDLILNLCKNRCANAYISGSGGKNYMNLDDFREAKVQVVFQKYQSPSYSQLHPKLGFVPDLSILDLLFNEGQKSKSIIESGRIH